MDNHIRVNLSHILELLDHEIEDLAIRHSRISAYSNHELPDAESDFVNVDQAK